MVIHYNYVFLLVGLLLLLTIPAVGIQYGLVTGVVYYIIFPGTLVLGVWTLRSRQMFYVGWALVGAQVLANLSTHFLDLPALRYVSLCVGFAFFFLTTLIALRDVLLGGAVDLNRLVGAMCIYLMLGINWGLLYLFVDTVSPGSFAGLSATNWDEELLEFIYHSFVTLTTLGYGDLAPVSPLARVLSYLEAVFGQIYLTVLVAALVGIHIATWRAHVHEKANVPALNVVCASH